jgi:hypothetical protein
MIPIIITNITTTAAVKKNTESDQTNSISLNEDIHLFGA